MKRKLFTVILFCLFTSACTFAENFSGYYVLKAPDNTVTLSLTQNDKGIVTGSLSSTTGTTFSLNGEVDDDVAIGVCGQGTNSIPFEAHFEGNTLLFSLIGEGQQDIKVLSFPLDDKKKRPAAEMLNSLAPSYDGQISRINTANKAKQSTLNLNSAANSEESLLGNWICRGDNGSLSLQFISADQLVFNGDAAGYSVQGNQIIVTADGETLSYPYLFKNNCLIITFPDGVQAQFTKDSNAVAAQTTSGGANFQQLTGRWKDIRSSGNTIIELFATGQYSYYSDYVAGNSQTGQTNWGYGNSSANKGTWRAQGTPEKGTIFYQSQDGSQDTLSYQVHTEGGNIYWNEYYFDGKLYCKE